MPTANLCLSFSGSRSHMHSRSTLIAHVLINLKFCPCADAHATPYFLELCHHSSCTCSRVLLLLISLIRSISQVNRLPKYTNSVTCSTPISYRISVPLWCSPAQTPYIVMVLFKCWTSVLQPWSVSNFLAAHPCLRPINQYQQQISYL